MYEHLTKAPFSSSVISVSVSSGPNDTPPANSEAPVVHTSPPRLPLLQRKMIIPFILLVLVVTAIIIGVTLFRNSQSQKTSQSNAPPSQTPPVKLKTGYQNPFDKNAQYDNPFENLK